MVYMSKYVLRKSPAGFVSCQTDIPGDNMGHMFGWVYYITGQLPVYLPLRLTGVELRLVYAANTKTVTKS